MKLTILVLLLISSCSHKKKASWDEIHKYCQDLNVLFQKIEAINSNIVNEKTTRVAKGGPYKRLIVKNCKSGICETVEDDSPPILTYEPNHPDADKNGYVPYPDIMILSEKADQEKWKRIYEMVYKNAPVDHSFFFKDPRAKQCFKKYPYLKKNKDLSEYLGR